MMIDTADADAETHQELQTSQRTIVSWTVIFDTRSTIPHTLLVPVVHVNRTLDVLNWEDCELGASQLFGHPLHHLYLVLWRPDLPIEGLPLVVLLKIDPLPELVCHNRVLNVSVPDEHIKVGKYLEVVEKVRVVVIDTGCDGNHSRNCLVHQVRKLLLSVQQSLHLAW